MRRVGVEDMGALKVYDKSNSHSTGPDYQVYWGRMEFNAGKSNNIYGGSSTVRPDSLGTQFIIKY